MFFCPLFDFRILSFLSRRLKGAIKGGKGGLCGWVSWYICKIVSPKKLPREGNEKKPISHSLSLSLARSPGGLQLSGVIPRS